MTFQTFTGKDYLKIDIANNFGLDKRDWDERLAWFENNEHQLGSLVKQAEEPALFYAGCVAWEKAKQGQPSGYPISLDATCSGIQILACLAGDRKAASLVNVIDTGRREDAYTTLYHYMVEQLGGISKIERSHTKEGIMTAFYGSTALPKRIFGEGEQLEVFYRTMEENAPGAWEINQTMLAIWDPTVLEHNWTMPDNFHVKIKVMGHVSETVQFLNEPFEITYSKNMPIEGGRSLGANTVHSVDGMIVREMGRRCMYDSIRVNEIGDLIARGVRTKGISYRGQLREQDQMVQRLWELYQKSGFLSARILDYLDADNMGLVDHEKLNELIMTLPMKPFELISVHDCFRCLPNYGNDLRWQYNNLLALIAESELLSFLMSQITGRQIQVQKLDPFLARDIRDANYALS